MRNQLHILVGAFNDLDLVTSILHTKNLAISSKGILWDRVNELTFSSVAYYCAVPNQYVPFRLLVPVINDS